VVQAAWRDLRLVRGEHLRVDASGVDEALTAMHHAMPDGVHRTRAQRREDLRDRIGVRALGAEPLDETVDGRGARLGIDHLVLEARGARVQHEDVHGARSIAGPSAARCSARASARGRSTTSNRPHDSRTYARVR